MDEYDRRTTIKVKKFNTIWTNQGAHHTKILLQNTVYWCNLKVAKKKGLQFYQTRRHAFVLYNTLPAICIEKAVCMKTKEERYHWVLQSPMLPRVILKPNSQSGQQDQPDREARQSSDHQSVSGSFGETRSGNVDYRIPGIPHSTIQQQDTNRKEAVKKLIQHFENHQPFLQDLIKTEKIHKFSEESKNLITDMSNTEIFELFESSSKKQCPDCAFHCELDIVYCLCGRSLKPSQRTKQLDKKNYDASSIPGYVFKKDLTHGAKHGASNGHECTTRSRRCCTKLANPSKPFWKDGTMMVNTASLCQMLGGLRSKIFSMTNLHWKTTLLLQHERKEIETRKNGYSRWLKRVSKSTSWFRWSKTNIKKTAWWTCERDFRRKYTDTSYTMDKTTKKPTIRRTCRIWLSSRSSNTMEVLSFEVTGKPAASNIFVFIKLMGTVRRLEVEQKLEFLTILIMDWTQVIFVQRCFFACWKSPGNWWRSRQKHLPHTTFSRAQSLHSTDDMCSLTQGAWGLKTNCVPKTFTLPRVMFHFAPHGIWTPAQVLSHLLLLCYCRPLLRTRPLWRSAAGWYFHGIPLLHIIPATEPLSLWHRRKVGSNYSLPGTHSTTRRFSSTPYWQPIFSVFAIEFASGRRLKNQVFTPRTAEDEEQIDLEPEQLT